jgi:ornithine carbamoyltransferase
VTALNTAPIAPARIAKQYPVGHRLGRSATHLLSIADLDPVAIHSVLDDAAELKSGLASALSPAAAAGRLPLAGKSVALIFDKPSLRTRVSFEVGIAKLGGTTTCLTGAEIGLGGRESVADIARTLSRYVDAIVIRTLSHDVLTQLADAADVPVINALTEWEHPCQALADLLTLREHLGTLAGRQLTFIGDGNNVCHSLLLASATVGLDMVVASPNGYWPDQAILDQAAELARESGAQIDLTDDPVAGVRGADAVYTDVWASMGDEDEATDRRRAFQAFKLSASLLTAAPDALVMHCLPAHRGDEIDDEVIDGPNSVVFDQAENRMYVQQAVLLHLLRASAVRRPVLVPTNGGAASPTR